MPTLETRKITRTLLRGCVFPLLFYFLCFCLLSNFIVFQISSTYITHPGDGPGHIWSYWWFGRALTYGQTPWHTDLLHFPFGTTLYPSALQPFNSVLIFLLRHVCNQFTAHNVIVIFSFVVAGYTAFLLAHHLTRCYAGSLLAGYLFTFSNMHFGHLRDGMLHMISLEWIPLFTLMWLRCLQRPAVGTAIWTAFSLFLCLMCDYYHFLYAGLIGLVMAIWYGFHLRSPWYLLRPPYRLPLLVAMFLILLSCGWLVTDFLYFTLVDPLGQGHAAEEYSLDLLGPFIPGVHWIFSLLTRPFWSSLASFTENSVYIGPVLIGFMIFLWFRRRSVGHPYLTMWIAVFLVGYLLALGPHLQIWGKQHDVAIMPYHLLITLFPPLKISGLPVRMSLMMLLGATMMAAIGFRHLSGWGIRSRGGILLVLLLIVEQWPKPLYTFTPSIPSFYQVLKAMPGRDAVLDTTVADHGQEFQYYYSFMPMYYQTIHEKPLAFGNPCRTPYRIFRLNGPILELVRTRRFDLLYSLYRIRYLIINQDLPAIRLLGRDGRVRLYDLAMQP